MRRVETTEPNTAQENSRDAEIREELRGKGFHVPPRDAWMKNIGWAKDDPVYDEAMRLGAEWRAEVNRQSLAELDAQEADS